MFQLSTYTMHSFKYKVCEMRFNRHSLNIFSFQTFVIASAIGFRAGSWDVFLLTAVALMAVWIVLSQFSEMAIFYIATAIGCLWGAGAVFVARGVSSPVSAMLLVLLAFAIGFAGNYVALQYMRLGQSAR